MCKMIYKMNLFFREWEGYDKVYNFFREHILLILLVRASIYVNSLLILFLTDDPLKSILRLIIYVPVTVAEYFLGAIYYEQNEKTSSFCSYLLIFLNFIVIFLCLIQLIIPG